MILLTGLGLAGTVVSAYIWFKQVTTGPVLCIGSGCAHVIRSRYGRLFGIPNGALGVFFFLAVAVTPLGELWVPGFRSVMMLGTAVALMLYLYLTYLQLFVLHSLCSWCLTSAALTAGIFWSLLRLR